MKDSIYTIVGKKYVLKSAIELISTATKTIILTKCDTDNSEVQPDGTFYAMIQKKISENIIVTRVYYGEESKFITEKKNNNKIKYYYGGDESKYQRAIIVDDALIMTRLNNIFVKSVDSEFIHKIKRYILPD